MMVHWGWLFAALVLGAALGIGIMSLFVIAGEQDREEQIYMGGGRNAEANRTTHLAGSQRGI